MNTESAINTELLNLFVSASDFRAELKKPFRYENYDGATDGHIALFLPHEEGVDYPPLSLDVKSIFPPRAKEPQTVSVNEIRKVLKAIPLVDEMVDGSEVACADCNGDGIEECFHCGSEVDCEECEGSGKVVSKVPSGKKVFPERGTVKLRGIHFRAHLLNRLVIVAERFGVNEIKWVSEKNKLRGNEFEIGPARVVIMPCREEESSD